MQRNLLTSSGLLPSRDLIVYPGMLWGLITMAILFLFLFSTASRRLLYYYGMCINFNIKVYRTHDSGRVKGDLSDLSGVLLYDIYSWPGRN